jgi:hypothetical protein
MINLFYNPSYIKSPKVFLTKSFKYSVFYNLYLNFLYAFNLPIQNSLIKSGPHKRMNNLVIAFRDDPDFVFNKNQYRNSYIVQFDKFGEEILIKILKESKNTQILIGPLYSQEYLLKLIDYMEKYPNIKQVVASQSVYLSTISEMGIDMDKNKIVIFPSGVISNKDLLKNLKLKQNSDRCLIYFKKRTQKELDQIKKFLESKNIEYKVFKYGEYKNRELKKYALNAKFGIFLSGTESQGFAAQELFSCNLPLLVWDQKINIYDNLTLTGTSMSYWSNSCGMIVDNFDELSTNFHEFYENIYRYKPHKLVESKLTFEKYKENLKIEFHNF